MKSQTENKHSPVYDPLKFRPRCETLEDRLTPAITVKFDYTYDAAGMFNDPARREALERAADAVTARMTDSLGAIAPSGSNTWTARVYDSASGRTLTFANPTINPDEIVVYITSGYLGGALAIASSPGFSAQGSSEWFNQIRTRGEAAGTDIGPWGGLIAFNTNYAFSSDGTPTSNEFDLQSVATHELLHVFGLGMQGASYTRYTSTGAFTGPNTVALLGRGAPLQPGGDHIASGFGYNGQESILTPSITRGQVKGMSELEYAMLSDIGWDQSRTSPPTAVVPPVVVPPPPPPPVVVVSPPPVVVPPAVPPVVISPPAAVPPVVVPPVVVTPPVVVAPAVPVVAPPPPVSNPLASVTPKSGRQFTVGSDAGGLPTYSAYDSSGRLVASGLAFSSTFRGGVRAATGDVNGDGVNDSLVVAGAGSAAHVRVFDGRTNSMIFNFLAFNSLQRAGANIAAGDVNGDGKDDIVVGLVNGSTRIFSGANGQLLAELLGQGSSGLSLGDVNGDGYADVAVASGTAVSIWDGRSIANRSPQRLAGDVSVGTTAGIALADIDGDGRADLVAGAGANSPPMVRVYAGSSILANQPRLVSEFLAADANFRTGVRLAAADMNNDGRDDIIAVPAGVGSGTLRVFSGRSAASGIANPTVVRTMWNTEWAATGVWIG
jgi:hypothetical protein